MATVESREWYMEAYAPEGIPSEKHLKLRTVHVSLVPDSIPEGYIVVESFLFSIDPYLRSRMTGREDGLYFPQFNLNEVIQASAVGRVVVSRDNNYTAGDLVLVLLSPVAEYFMVMPSQAITRKIDPNAGTPLTDYITSLGLVGFAAWVGIEVIGQPKAGSNVFISAAAGGVGMYSGQLAKIKGCRVVGSAGSDEKVKLLKEEFGYDEAFNYKKETDFDSALARYFPNGIDLYLDNVGGKMLEAVLNHVNKYAKIPVCGMISDYNKVWTNREGVRNLLNMVGKEVRMEGYLVGSYLDRFANFAKEMASHEKEGKIRSKLKVYNGIHQFVESLESLFTGSNIGKVIVKVKDY